MNLTIAFWKKHIKESLLIGLLAIPWIFIYCEDCWSNWHKLKYDILMFVSFWVVLWKGNEILNCQIARWISWLEAPLKRFIINLILSTAFTILAVMGLMFLFTYFFDMNFGNSYWSIVYSAIGVTLFISLILYAKSFLLNWRKLELNATKMKEEHITSQYETLKNQVNPHFLFNSLNALMDLIYANQDLAARFVKELSEVYRYVLDQKDKELIPLNLEVKFAQKYLFLEKIRYGDNLMVDIDLDVGDNVLVPPLAIQMLTENAIKHNTISKEEPLTIEIKTENDEYLIITNNLQKKNNIKNSSSKIGLNNIRSRYGYLSNKEVSIVENDEKFIVKLPFLYKMD